jgi:hypothetical protein
LKKCYKCQTTKDKSEFSNNPTRKDGLNSLCRECYSLYQREWYKKNKVIHKERTRDRNDIIRNKNQIKVWEYLSTHPCVDCGEGDIIVLEFDHITDDKLNNVSTLLGGSYSWETILKEIEKCEVRCANCHRRITAIRQNWRVLNYAPLT